MSNSANNNVSETTALLRDNPSAPAKNVKKSVDSRNTCFGLWRPTYWSPVFIIFMIGIISGPTVSLMVPFLKELFCERGIPTFFPIPGVPGNEGNDTAKGTPDNSDGHCDSAEYSAAIGKFMGLSTSLAAVLTTLTVRFWSKLGDRIGRKHALLLCSCGSMISISLSLFVRLHKGSSLLLLIVAESFEGATGSAMSYNSLAYAYASDVTTPEERTVVFGRIFAGFYTGIAVGSAVGGIVAKNYGLYGVFVVLLPVLALINFLFIAFMPESLSSFASAIDKDDQVVQPTVVVIEDENGQRRIQKVLPRTILEHARYHLENFFHGVQPEKIPDRLAGKYSILVLMIAMSIVTLAASGVVIQLSNYLLYRFQWDDSMLSNLFTYIGITRLFSMTLILPMIKRLAPPDAISNPAASIHFDLKITFAGLVIEAITFFVYGATPYVEGIYLGGLTGSVGAMFAPAIRGIISQSVAPEMLGTAMGTMSTFESAAVIAGPVLSGLLYSATLDILPSALFYAAGALSLLSAMLALSVLLNHRTLTQK